MHQNKMNEIDLQLRIAVDEARQELIDKQKLDLSGRTEIPTRQFVETSKTLTKIAKQEGVDFVFSLTLNKNDALFTSTSQSEEEFLGAKTFKTNFLDRYEHSSQILLNIFDTGKRSFDEYSDSTGNFRTLFQPFFIGDEVSFILAADISLEKVQKSLSKTYFSSLLLGTFLCLIAFPLIWLLLRSINKEHEAEKLLLNTDAETGLYNFAKLNSDIEQTAHNKLLLVNIENYNNILNTIGYSSTKHITQQFINRIHLFLEVNSFDANLYAVSSHKFALLSKQEFSEDDEANIKNLFNALIKTGYGINSSENIHLSLRIGASTGNNNLFLLANMALEKAKIENKSIVYFDSLENLPETYRENLKQSGIFHNALAENRIKAFFQPLMDVNNGKINKFECLARVIDENGNVIQMPEDFIPVAYASRLGHKITKLMLQQSLQEAQEHEHNISINIAVSDLQDQATMNFICNMLDEHPQSAQIEFEILEHESISDYNKVAAMILQLKKRGCRVGMDDLGKHYSNFDRLTNLPLDFVKIDGAIVPFIEEDETALIIARNIVELAKGRNLKIVAEHCINETVFKAAAVLGIDYVQGFFIGLPSPSIAQALSDQRENNSQLMHLFPILEKPITAN